MSAWRLELPSARHESLADFRVAVMPPLEVVQPSSAMRAKVDELAAFMSDTGAKVDEAMPAIDQEGYLRDYVTALDRDHVPRAESGGTGGAGGCARCER